MGRENDVTELFRLIVLRGRNESLKWWVEEVLYDALWKGSEE